MRIPCKKSLGFALFVIGMLWFSCVIEVPHEANQTRSGGAVWPLCMSSLMIYGGLALLLIGLFRRATRRGRLRSTGSSPPEHDDHDGPR